MKTIGIAGGSGSGKSTLAIGLYKRHPERVALLHVDDYFKKKEDAPQFNGVTNWDHPDAIRFDDLYRDLLSLKNGIAINVSTKSELYNPNYNHPLRNKIAYTIDSKPIIILEGYLAFFDQRVCGLLDYKVYLDILIEDSSKRRSANKSPLSREYFNNVLKPMHKTFVEPTKKYADFVLNVSTMGIDEVLKTVGVKL